MNKQQSLHNIWTETDKPIIEMMMKKTSQSPSTDIVNDSSDDDSDLESLGSSCNSFVAVPKEFRPPLEIRTKMDHPKISLNETKQLLSNQNFVTAPKITMQETLPKVPLLATPSVQCRRISNQNETPNIRKNTPPSKQTENLQKNQKVTENKANVEKYSNANKKLLHQPAEKMADKPLQKHNNMIFKTRPKCENRKNVIKYECVERQEHKTVKFNFEMPSNLLYKNGLKIDVKMGDLEQQKDKKLPRKNANKFFYNGVKQDNKDAHTALYQQNNVKWVNSFNKDDNIIRNETEKQTNNHSHKISYQENLVKWDSSLNVKDLSTDGEYKIGQDTGKKVAFEVFCQENTIKWNDSLNRKDSSSDDEGRIEWTVIHEKKTIVSAKKVDHKNHNYKQFNDKYLPKKPCKQNEQKKPRRRNHNNYRNNNNVKSCDTGYQRNTIPKSQPSGFKDAVNQVNKNDLNHNDSTKNDSIKIHCNELQESSSDTENFTRQCKISEKNTDTQNAIPCLINDRATFLTNFHEKETVDKYKSSSHPEKTDNNALKIIEDQKKSMLHYGREMSDLIIGSHRALSMFISMFKEWKKSRLELINHFGNLETNLKESSKKFTRYKDMLNIAKTSVSVAAAIPLPHVSIAARVISVLTGLFSVFLSTTERKSVEIEDASDISITALRDTNASTELYMYGLQCGQQFEETIQFIEEFHSNTGDPVIFENDSPEIATFIRGVLEYKPKHRIFYKKFHKCFQELLHNSTSEFGKRFCEPFLLYTPEAVDVIGYLNWRFRHEDFNGESVRFELQQIEYLLEGNDTSIKDLAGRIKKCVGILQDEMKFFERCVEDISLFEKPEHIGIKTLQF